MNTAQTEMAWAVILILRAKLAPHQKSWSTSMETTPGIPSIKVTRTVKRFRGRATPVARPVRFTAPRAAKPMAAEATAVPTARRIRISSTSRRKPSTKSPVSSGAAATP